MFLLPAEETLNTLAIDMLIHAQVSELVHPYLQKGMGESSFKCAIQPTGDQTGLDNLCVGQSGCDLI